MTPDSKRLHVFISHYHKDDTDVGNLTKLLNGRGYDVRNSSIRANPKNQERLNKGLVKEETIRRLLRMKISWAGKVIVLIGKDTHTRRWVNWEIEQAHKQNKDIIGVFARGATDADVPASLRKYGCGRVAWNADSIVAALEGTDAPFQDSDGTASPTPAYTARSTCGSR
jgi:hypothetical protein